jgi:hypothetical protein
LSDEFTAQLVLRPADRLTTEDAMAPIDAAWAGPPADDRDPFQGLTDPYRQTL